MASAYKEHEVQKGAIRQFSEISNFRFQILTLRFHAANQKSQIEAAAMASRNK